MELNKIELINFRNFSKEEFEFHPGLTAIVGENAKGKTNLLEAIHFLTMGSGFRESKEQELVMLGTDESKVYGEFHHKETALRMQIMLRRQDGTIEKIYSVNKARKRFAQYKKEVTKSVLFSPEQIHIMIGSPEDRRQYFDKVLSTQDDEYHKRLINYENALRKRNKILEHHHSDQELLEELAFWNGYLVEQASYITQARIKYVQFLNIHKKIQEREFYIEYVDNPFTLERLDETFEIEKRYRRTVIGPQKDDFVIYQHDLKDKKNLHHFGSRSEQRLAVFWLKLNEIQMYENHFGLKPILLLDDIFSELDRHNQLLVLSVVSSYQTIMTATEIDVLRLRGIDAAVIKL